VSKRTGQGEGQRPDLLLESIAANVRRWRGKRGQTQEELAVALGVDLRHVQRIEKGALDIRMTTLARIAAALETTPGELVRKAKLAPAKRGRPKKVSVN
jgi:transcriptional regulator with XRE-family HTH domain